MHSFIKTIILSLILLVLMNSIAFADDITFRNAQWGSNYSSVINSLTDLEVSWRSPEDKLGILIADEVITSLDKPELNFPDICYVRSRNSSAKVAGYDVDEVALYFAYTPDSTGKINRAVDNTSFYMACYEISTDESGYTASIKDLKQKLTSIYGTPKEVDMSDDCNATTKDYYQWTGSNGTFVYMNGEPNDVWNYYYVRLWYGISNGDSLVRQAERLQDEDTTQKLQEGGTSGL